MLRLPIRLPCSSLQLQQLRTWQSRRWVTTQNETAPWNARGQKRAKSWSSPYKLILGFIPIFTFGLGTWQLKRLQWKLDLINELQEQVEKDPMTLPRNINLKALPEFEWRRVNVTGEWDNAHSILLGPRVKDNKNGFNLVTPLKRPGATTVLVDRGFVEHDLGPAAREGKMANAAANGVVEVVGMLRLQQTKNAFTPENKPEMGEWYWPDIEQLAEYAGGKDAGVQPVLIEAIHQGTIANRLQDLNEGRPVGRSAIVDVRNEHATYAIIW
ncbi:surf-like protein [Tulasnella sp. 330]|nr:surf-like protein [Tulasnella sp. 330]KAG8881187.1 surf-like protein [Tulasnella sp. 331]